MDVEVGPKDESRYTNPRTDYQKILSNWLKPHVHTFQSHNLTPPPPTPDNGNGAGDAHEKPIPLLAPVLLKNTCKRWERGSEHYCFDLDDTRKTLIPDNLSARTILRDRMSDLNNMNPSKTTKDVGRGQVLFYDCAPFSLSMGLMAAMHHLNTHFPDRYSGKLLRGDKIKSIRAYNDLSLINKLTCNILPLKDWEEAGWSSSDRESVEANKNEIHSQLSDLCKLLFLKYESFLGLLDGESIPQGEKLAQHRADTPTLFMHYFARKYPVAAPLRYPQNDKRSDPQDRGDSKLQEQAWKNGRYNVFAGEWGCSGVGGSKPPKIEAERQQKEDWTNTWAITQGDNYVQSLLDYIRFLYQTTRYGFRGTPTRFVFKGKIEQAYERRAAIMNVEEKGMILLSMHENFWHYYACNLQMEGLLEQMGDNLGTFSLSKMLLYKDSDSSVDRLSPNLVPLRSTSYNINFTEISKVVEQEPLSKLIYYVRNNKPSEFKWKLLGDTTKNILGGSVNNHKTIKLQEWVNPMVSPHVLVSSDVKRLGEGESPFLTYSKVTPVDSFDPKEKKMVRTWVDVEGSTVHILSNDEWITLPDTIEVPYNKLDGSYKDMTRKGLENNKFLDELMGLKKPSDPKVSSTLEASLLVIDAVDIYHNSTIYIDENTSGLSKRFVSELIGPEKERVYNNASTPQVMAFVQRFHLQTVLSKYDSIGDMFRLNISFPCATYYFGNLKHTPETSGMPGHIYAPVAVIFNNTDTTADRRGGTSGHYWAECKLPTNFGEAILERPAVVNVISNKKSGHVVERLALEKDTWFHFDNLQDNGLEDWDLLRETPYGEPFSRLLPIHGGSTDNFGDSDDPANNWPVHSDKLGMTMIKKSMASAGTALDGDSFVKKTYTKNAITKKLEKHYRLAIVDGDWHIIMNKDTPGLAKIDSVIYARVKEPLLGDDDF